MDKCTEKCVLCTVFWAQLWWCSTFLLIIQFGEKLESLVNINSNYHPQRSWLVFLVLEGTLLHITMLLQSINKPVPVVWIQR
jgi:hypothetical protein